MKSNLSSYAISASFLWSRLYQRLTSLVYRETSLKTIPFHQRQEHPKFYNLLSYHKCQCNWCLYHLALHNDLPIPLHHLQVIVGHFEEWKYGNRVFYYRNQIHKADLFY